MGVVYCNVGGVSDCEYYIHCHLGYLSLFLVLLLFS